MLSSIPTFFLNIESSLITVVNFQVDQQSCNLHPFQILVIYFSIPQA